MKLAHLVLDEKFPDSAYILFEEALPKSNDFYLIHKDPKYRPQYLDCFSPTVVTAKQSVKKAFIDKLEKYDAIIIHSLCNQHIKIVNRLSEKVTIVWIGMGYDYYDLIFPDPNEMLGPRTLELKLRCKELEPLSRKRKVLSFLGLDKKLDGSRFKSKIRSISKVDIFSPVCLEEYELIKDALEKINVSSPEYVEWNYATSRKLKKIQSKYREVTELGDILVGNSATYTNNHLDIFDLLESMSISKSRKIICPLSYGPRHLQKAIKSEGEHRFGEQFIALTGFLPLDEYTQLIGNCSHMIMGHLRQQGAGNVSQALQNGLRVFMDDRSPLYMRYKRLGLHVDSTQELKAQPEIIHQCLDIEIQRNNYSFYQNMRKTNNSVLKTKNLISVIGKLNESK